MNRTRSYVSLVVAAALALLASPINTVAAEVAFEKQTLDTTFRSEGVAIADINKDGKHDVIVGDVWYAAPDWKPHEIRKPAQLKVPGDYSEAFGVYDGDFNADGWPDVMVIPFHGKDAKWYANPQGKEGHWVERTAFPKTGNETRLYLDLFGDGKKVFLMGVDDVIAWVGQPADVKDRWPVAPISEGKTAFADKYAHGIGAGDVNGDGRLDVLTPAGWYEQPEGARKSTTPWKFHATKIGDQAADMYAVDLDGDGKRDVISSSAHGRGIWWHKQVESGGKTEFKTTTLHDKIPVTHSLNYVDVNGDGRLDLVTGQRPGTHGSRNFPEMSELVWFEVVPAKDNEPVKLVPHVIDEQSGIGTQFVTADFNGDKKLDIVVSNKKGVFVFLQK